VDNDDANNKDVDDDEDDDKKKKKRMATSAIHRSISAFSGVEGLFCRETVKMEDDEEEEEEEGEGKEGEKGVKNVSGRRHRPGQRPQRQQQPQLQFLVFAQSTWKPSTTWTCCEDPVGNEFAFRPPTLLRRGFCTCPFVKCAGNSKRR